MTCQILRNEGPECRGDDPWDVFIADEDDREPEPEYGDFWPDDDLPSDDAARLEKRLPIIGGEARSCSL